MADIRPTPISNYPAYYGAGLLSGLNEAVSKPFGYENDPVRALTNLLGIPSVVKTLENTAYGMPNVTGTGMATQLRPEAKEAVGNLLPMAPTASKLAAKGIVASGKYIAPELKFFNPSTGLLDVPMYHGTGVPITELQPGKSGAIFVSPSPRFASDIAFEVGGRPGGMANVLPVFTNVKRPFDYEKKVDLKSLIKSYEALHGEPIITAKESLKGKAGLPVLQRIKEGDWSIIENAKIQQAIKNAGFDSFHVKENGVKNLGVYDTTNIRSAFEPTFNTK